MEEIYQKIPTRADELVTSYRSPVHPFMHNLDKLSKISQAMSADFQNKAGYTAIQSRSAGQLRDQPTNRHGKVQSRVKIRKIETI